MTTILSAFGWLPGDYSASCQDCDQPFLGSKRSYRCEACATKAYDAHMARQQTIEVVQEHVTVTTNEILVNAMRTDNPLPLREAIMAGVEALLVRLGMVRPADDPSGTPPPGNPPTDDPGSAPDLVQRAQTILARAEQERSRHTRRAATVDVTDYQRIEPEPVEAPLIEVPVETEASPPPAESSDAPTCSSEVVTPITFGQIRDIMDGRSRAPIPLRPRLATTYEPPEPEHEAHDEVEPEPNSEGESEPKRPPITLSAAETFMDRVMAENLALREQDRKARKRW